MPDDALQARTGDRIALYGSLMRDLGAMDELGAIGGLRFEGSCVIPGQLVDLGAYPGLRLPTGRVLGEIYCLLDLETLAILDQFEDFDPARPRKSLYLRERVELLEPTRTPAWVYVYNHAPGPNEIVVESGDWRAHLAARGRARAR